MPTVSSPLATTQSYIPVVSQAQLGRAAGLHLHFATLTALNAAVTTERTNITGDAGIWTDGQPFTIATEASTGTYRTWNLSLQHVRTVHLSAGKAVVLAADSNAVIASAGVPNSGTGNNGDLAIDTTAGTYYVKSAGTWGSSTSIAGASTVAGISDMSTDARAFNIAANNTAMRTALGVAIGTDVQAYNAGLASLAGLSLSANQGIYATGANTYTTFSLTAAGRAILDDASSGAQLTTLGLTANGVSLVTAADYAAMRTLLNVANGATANSADATLLARANHTGTQTATTISDLTETVQDMISSFLVQGTNITLTYNDAGNQLTIAATGSAGVTDGDKTDITVSSSGAVWTIDNNVVTNAKLTTVATSTIKGRVTAGTGNVEDLTAAQVRTLINVADGATANSTDATLLGRANHTGTQTAATISDLTETVQDMLSTFLVQGSNITLTYNDAGNQLTIASTGTGAALTVEDVSTTTYTFIADDNGKIKRFTNASGCTVTLPQSLGAGWNVSVIKGVSAGTITFVTSGSAALVSTTGDLTLTESQGMVSIIPQATDSYLLKGEVGTFAESVQDVVGALVTGAGGTYNDAGNTITLPFLPLAGGTVAGATVFSDAVSVTGVRSYAGAVITTATAMAAATAFDVTKSFSTKSIAVDTTFTFSNATPTANTRTTIGLTNTDATNPRTVTIPSCYSDAQKQLITSFVLPPSAYVELLFHFDGAVWRLKGEPQIHEMMVSVGAQNSVLVAGTGVITIRSPFAMVLVATPKLSLSVASSSGLPTVDVNLTGTGSIFSTVLTCDATEKTSTTATTAAVLSTTRIAADAELTFDVDVAGTGTQGPIVTFYYVKG